MPHTEFARNAILASLPVTDLNRLLEAATSVEFPVGHTLLGPGDPYSSVFFPTTGVVAGVTVLSAGESVELAAVGSDGIFGIGPVLGLTRAPVSFVAQFHTQAVVVRLDVFMQLLNESEPLRRLVLAYTGRLLAETARAAVCNRFHSHQGRLARWLVVASRRANTPVLDFTHDFIAQMVGGPRHAVTAGLSRLRAMGALRYRRSQVVIVDQDGLVNAACECARSAHLVP